MDPGDARRVIVDATHEDTGTFTTLRLGQDPDADRVRELRAAINILWRHYRELEVLPLEISRAAAVILHFRPECEQNLRDQRDSLGSRLLREVHDLAQGAFRLLSGARDGD